MINNVPRDPIYYCTPVYIKTNFFNLRVYIKTNFFNLRAHTSLYIMVQTHSMINSIPRQ